MDATQLRHKTAPNKAAPSDSVSLALKALSEISEGADAGFDQNRAVDLFCSYLTKDTSIHRCKIVSYLHDLGLSDTDIVDGIIPAAARRVGEQWVDDKLTFSEVTCSAARMQVLSRFLGNSGAISADDGSSGTKILLIVPKDDQHTMGVFVAADQFRRLGLIVEIAIGQSLEDLKKTISSHEFSIFGVSAASRGLIEPVKTIVDILRDYDETALVALGGNILRMDDDLLAKINVDIATSDPSDVINMCGLPNSSHILSAING